MTDPECGFCLDVLGGLNTQPLSPFSISLPSGEFKQMTSRNPGFVIKSTMVGEGKLGALKVWQQISDWNNHRRSEMGRP